MSYLLPDGGFATGVPSGLWQLLTETTGVFSACLDSNEDAI